ncbi:unnamed protein product [Paramecium primaurelia]|uniref:Uncharacterized protein n=1 Tax=Paramecium primaurelia TaxID=5886 RepID=A0A8S1L0G7_PARPR|nr:unnamed protein product [Paramecium primaurelia]CAD8060947.1 unnamed protein product [Paramecium primaurelia]
MGDQRNVSSDDLIYFFQINYLHQMRRKTKHKIYQPQIQETQIIKSNTSHIPPSILSSQNLNNTYTKYSKQKQENNKLQFKASSISTKQLNQIFINNRNIIRRHRVSLIQNQPDKSLDSLITRKKSSNFTFTETSQKRILEKCDWLQKPIKINLEKNRIQKIRHNTIIGENFKNLNGWQIENEYDCDF